MLVFFWFLFQFLTELWSDTNQRLLQHNLLFGFTQTALFVGITLALHYANHLITYKSPSSQTGKNL